MIPATIWSCGAPSGIEMVNRKNRKAGKGEIVSAMIRNNKRLRARNITMDAHPIRRAVIIQASSDPIASMLSVSEPLVAKLRQEPC